MYQIVGALSTTTMQQWVTQLFSESVEQARLTSYKYIHWALYKNHITIHYSNF